MASKSSSYVYFFGDPLPADSDSGKNILGGKGDSLAAMTRAGLPVPPGFTLTTATCAEFYALNKTWPEGLEEAVREHLQRLEKATGRTFGAGPKPLFVSVRSGAPVSMPGMMDTLLNCGIHPGLADTLGDRPAFWHVFLQFVMSFSKTVYGLTSADFPEDMESPEKASRPLADEALAVFAEKTGQPFPTDPWESLKACINAVYLSWNSERAIAYRKRNKVENVSGTAVNVQAMFPSETSGIVFTLDPNALDSGRMVIESAYGLGEAVVSGEVTPDRFLVKRDNPADAEIFPGNKTSSVAAMGDGEIREIDRDALTLDPPKVQELASLALRVEEFFGHPVDIEWGFAEGRFALLQSRAIRGLDVIRETEIGRTEEIDRLRKLAANREKIWIIHNLGETLRFPTPLTWDIVREFMSGQGGFGLMYQDFGYALSDEVKEHGFLELIAGRIYADPDRVAQLFWGGIPMGYDLDALRRDKSQMDRPPNRFFADKADETFILRLPVAIRAMFRSYKIMNRERPRIRNHFEQIVLPPYLDYVKKKRAENLGSLSDIDLIREIKDRVQKVLHDFGKESLKPPLFAGMAFANLQGLLTKALGEKEALPLAATLVMGLEGDTTWEQDSLLAEVAAGEVELERFLELYGHRSTGEMELGEARWREDPDYLRNVITRLQKNPGKSMALIHEENHTRSQEALAALPERLQAEGVGFLEPDIRSALAEARNLLAYREKGKHCLMMGYELIRLAILEFARRWDLGQDVFFLRFEELETWSPERRADLEKRIAARKIRWQAMQRLELDDLIDSRTVETLGQPKVITGGDTLTGDSISGGIGRGPVRVVHDPRETGDLGDRYILVCSSTDPGWTPLFMGASGLIVEKGGVLSHGAIVARDFGIPALVLPGATSLFKDGEMIRVDGNQGVVSRIKEEVSHA